MRSGSVKLLVAVSVGWSKNIVSVSKGAAGGAGLCYRQCTYKCCFCKCNVAYWPACYYKLTLQIHNMTAPPSSHLPQVHTRGDKRSLEFQPGMVQSEMRLSRPDDLVLSYARAMMCFVLFHPKPEHIVMVGLGGGSLAKFCYRYLPHSRITVLELRADVIALREQLAIPRDNARFRIIQADATTYMAGLAGAADVLLVDGFDAEGLPPALGSAAFYADCRRALRRLRETFQGRICWFRGIAGNNRILFAVKGGKPSPALSMQQKVARSHGLGLSLFNRLLAHWIVLRLRWGGPA